MRAIVFYGLITETTVLYGFLAHLPKQAHKIYDAQFKDNSWSLFLLQVSLTATCRIKSRFNPVDVTRAVKKPVDDRCASAAAADLFCFRSLQPYRGIVCSCLFARSKNSLGYYRYSFAIFWCN